MEFFDDYDELHRADRAFNWKARFRGLVFYSLAFFFPLMLLLSLLTSGVGVVEMLGYEQGKEVAEQLQVSNVAYPF